MGWCEKRMGMLLSKFGEGRGGGGFVVWFEEGGKSLSFSLSLPAYLPSSFEGSYGKW